jgi:hypothetical protein
MYTRRKKLEEEFEFFTRSSREVEHRSTPQITQQRINFRVAIK